MSGNTKLKKAARERQERTGEAYTTARMHVLPPAEKPTEHEPPAQANPFAGLPSLYDLAQEANVLRRYEVDVQSFQLKAGMRVTVAYQFQRSAWLECILAGKPGSSGGSVRIRVDIAGQPFTPPSEQGHRVDAVDPASGRWAFPVADGRRMVVNGQSVEVTVWGPAEGVQDHVLSLRLAEVTPEGMDQIMAKQMALVQARLPPLSELTGR